MQAAKFSGTLAGVSGANPMQVFNETVRILDPPLPPKEPTLSQRLFRSYLRGGEAEVEKEYQQMYPEKTLAA
jgi:hypothetical protein